MQFYWILNQQVKQIWQNNARCFFEKHEQLDINANDMFIDSNPRNVLGKSFEKIHKLNLSDKSVANPVQYTDDIDPE